MEEEERKISGEANGWIKFCLNSPTLEGKCRCLTMVLKKQANELLEIKEKWEQKSLDMKVTHGVLREITEEIREKENRVVIEKELVVGMERQEVKIIQV